MMQNTQTRISRRTFIACATAGTGLIVCGGLGCAVPVTYHAEVVNGRIPINRLKFHQLAEGKPVIIKAPNAPKPIILIQTDENSFRALSGECTHLKCHLRPSGNFLLCPCHGATFNLEGEVVRGPAEEPLMTYPVEVTGEQIRVTLF